ncbi:hypothetical protein HU200_018348 [Digitaria exilis]|uniref:Cytochrome P450 n=1 Tax=Digitaria exilis TaxID=1010633 RepID=A0A835F6B3_9POAL|nr:hypothetical protein HU200_018348 [Digitaria exilis]
MDELFLVSCLSLAAILLLSLHVNRTSATKETGARLPPGPWNLPVIGSLHHLVGAPPHRALLRLARLHGPVMLLRLGEVPAVVVSSPEAAAEVMKANDPVFASRPRGATADVVGFGGKGLIFAPYGEHWRQMRKVCVVELLSARQVRRMERIRQAEAATAMAASPSADAVINLSQGLTALTNNVIARAAFGGECRQQQAYLLEIEVVATLAAGFNLPDLFPSSRLARWLSGAVRDLRRSHARVERITAGIVQERMEKRSTSHGIVGADVDDEDLLDVLLRLQEEGSLAFPITTEIIGAVISDIFGAATDTTASTIEWAMAELIRNPQAMSRATYEVRQKLGQGRVSITNADLGDLHYLRMVIKETLRLRPPAPLILRASQENCQIMGYDIPRGSSVFINTFAVAQDPRYWDNPEEFLPERFESSTPDYRWTHFEFIPFGAGRRQCPGALFATTTIEITLANLLYHFDWALPTGGDPKVLDMSELFGITVRRRANLCMQASLHSGH